MKRPAVLHGALLFLALAPLASAQATRTWISGTGDDAKPCSRTEPGKTFAGAISKTAVGGEINVLDPGGFGAVTITKSITLDGGTSEGNILSADGNAITINAGTNDVVVLRNLQLEGTGTSLAGVSIISAGAVFLENCRVKGFAIGVSVAPSAAGTKVFVRGCLIQECATGISLEPTGDGVVVARLEDDRIEACGTGLLVNANASAMLGGCTIVGCSADGLKWVARGVIKSFRCNRIFGNNPDGCVSSFMVYR